MNKLTLISDNNNPSISHASAGNLRACIINPKENWTIDANTRDGVDARELTQITITTHNELTWTGTIQCFDAIHTFAINTFMALGEDPDIRNKYSEEMGELQTIIAHFSKTDQPPASELTTLLLLANEASLLEHHVGELRDSKTAANAEWLHLGTAKDQLSDAIYSLRKAMEVML